MTKKAAKTGPGPMVMVAMEQYYPEAERIISDELAYAILPLPFRIEVRLLGPVRDWIVAKSEHKVPGLWGGILARKRYVDDQLEEVGKGPIEAVVNLGAGFDTRAYRLPILADVPTWEVDLPGNVAAKKSRLEKLYGEVPPQVTLVPIDFDREVLASALASHGYQSDQTTFFIWEGVTQYVAEPGIRATLGVLASAPSGSRLVFTYIPKDFIDGENFYGQEYLYRQMLVKDGIWRFGIDPDRLDSFVAEYGWRVVEHLGYDELGERYVRPTGRNLQSLAIERIVFAERT